MHTPLPDVIELTSETEARRLWAGAERAWGAAATDLVALMEALDLGIHAAEVLVVHLLQPVRERFPATIGAQLASPAPDVDPHRDGIHVPHVLQFVDAIDLLSDDGLECVSPGMHRGWEDRRFACQRSRTAARETVGVTLSAGEQEQLLLLAAYRNRLFRCPPPVRVVPPDIHRALPALEHLVRRLLPTP